jgi:hypothetical protein
LINSSSNLNTFLTICCLNAAGGAAVGQRLMNRSGSTFSGGKNDAKPGTTRKRSGKGFGKSGQNDLHAEMRTLSHARGEFSWLP